MLFTYKKFKERLTESNIVEDVGDKTINDIIDNAYHHFKIIKKPINTLDIIHYVEQNIGKELDDDDYEDMYYKITGEDLDADEIFDLEEEEKYIVK